MSEEGTIPAEDASGTASPLFVAASEVEKKEHTRVFEVSDELAARSLSKWSEPVRLRLQVKEDGTYDLIAWKA